MNWKIVAGPLLAAVMLTGCGASGISFPAPSLSLKQTFEQRVPAPKAGDISRGQAFALIAALKVSEKAKGDAGLQLWLRDSALARASH